MDPIQLATYGGIVAVITFIFSSGERLKSMIASITNAWMATINLDELLAAAVYRWCFTNAKPVGMRTTTYYGCVIPSVDNVDKLAAFDVFKQSKLHFRKGLSLLTVQPGGWKYDQSTDRSYRSVELLLPRFMWNPKRFIERCVHAYNEYETVRPDRFSISRFYGKNKSGTNIDLGSENRPDRSLSGPRMLLAEVDAFRAQIIGMKKEDVYRYDGSKPFDWYAFPPDIMDVVNTARKWFNLKGFYLSKKIPWRRGWLIHGSQGTGKSLLAKCMAQDLGIPIFIFDLASMDNQEFETYWSQAQTQNPCMVLLEDFTTVFHGRENVIDVETQKLTFDCLLNCISGVESSDGMLLVITTNDVQYIDEALGVSDNGISSRPGRIDDIIMTKSMDEECRRIMAAKILDASTTRLEEVVQKTDGMSSAQFVEICSREALQKHFD